MNDTSETPTVFGERIVDIVRQHWKKNEQPLLLSQLGEKEGGAIASTTKSHAGSLNSYLKDRLAESLKVIRHSSIGGMIGVVPFDAVIPDQDVDALFVRSSCPASTKYHFAFLLAFRKLLPDSQRRFIHVNGPPHFLDLEQEAEQPNGYLVSARPPFSAMADDDFQRNWILRCGNSPRFGMLARPERLISRLPDRISRLSPPPAHRGPFPLRAGNE